MDASFDPYDLPDMSRGKRAIAGSLFMNQNVKEFIFKELKSYSPLDPTRML
jgi:hypothetical protein